MLFRPAKPSAQVRLPRALEPLTRQRRWICWRWVQRGGKRTKPPINPHTGALIDAMDPAHWMRAERAIRLAATEGGRCDGIGFVLSGDCGIGALDLDDCRDPKTGVLEKWARQIVNRAGSYAEVTPSGSGIRILGLAQGAAVHTSWPMPCGQLEVYRRAQRYITVTGALIAADGDQMADIDDLIDQLVDEYRPHRAHAVAIERVEVPDEVSLQERRALCYKYRIHSGWLQNCLLDRLRPGPGDDRSKTHCRIAHCLIERGVPFDDMFVLLKFTCWNKHRHENRCDEMVWHLIEYVAAQPHQPWRPS